MQYLLTLSLMLFMGSQVQAFASPLKRLIIISDLNGQYGSVEYSTDVHKSVKQMIKMKPDLVLSTGDMIAGQKSALPYAQMWQSFHEAVTTPLLKENIPMLVTVGNHDGSAYAPFKIERQHFISAWKDYPEQAGLKVSGPYPEYYSFRLQDMLFISLDSTLVSSLPITQQLWLEAELKQNQDAKYKVVFTHVPLFHFAQMPLTESYYDSGLYELLKQYEVKFYLSGHHHAYYPGFMDQMHFISQGCLGGGARALIGSKQKSKKSFTVIDFEAKGFKIYAHTGSDFSQKIDHSELPSKIEGSNYVLERRDIGE